MQPQKFAPTPIPSLRTQRHNWNHTIMSVALGIAVIGCVFTLWSVVTEPFPDGTTQTTAPNPAESPVIVVNAVLQIPTPTNTPEPTPTFTPKPSNLDKYGSCDGKKPGEVCVNPTFTPLPGMMPVLDGTPTRLPICDTVDENVLCIVPTPRGITDNDLVLD